MVHRVDNMIEVFDGLAFDGGHDDGANRFDDRAVRLTRNDCRGWCAAEAAMPRVRLHNNDDVFHVFHGAQGRLERRMQRNPQFANFDSGNFQNFCPLC